jgi:putative transposase
MKPSRFAEQQIAFALQQAEGGTAVAEVCRKVGIAEVRILLAFGASAQLIPA